MPRHPTFALIALALVPGLHAQQVRGIVRDSAHAAPLPGAVVTILDSTGSAVGRAISDAAGRFAFVVPAARAARVRVVRIGYRPREVSPVPGAETLEIAMAKLPPMLATVRVTDSELCPGATTSSGAVELWEQAKAGLLATIVARETKPAQMQALTYKRVTTTTDERVTQQTSQLTSAYSNRPFIAAAEASFFARRGFMQEDAGGRLYNAPDADVLLDEDFAATHCFHTEAPDKDHPDQIGLAFSPARGRDALVEVTGVIWIDRVTPQLRSLDFRYTGLEPVAMRAGSGGHIEFRTMENGLSFIERWNLRLVRLAADERPRDAATAFPNDRRTRTDFRVADLYMSGGMVLAAMWPDGTAWRDSTSGLKGTVVQLHSPLSIPTATISLVGANLETQTAADGSFELAPIVPGRYIVTVTDTALTAYAAPRSTQVTVDVTRGRLTNIRVELTPLIDVVRDICREQPMPRGTSTIVGRVSLPGVSRPPGRVVARWQANFNNGAPVVAENGVGRPVAINGAEQRVNLDDQGHFVVCGVARGRPIHLRYAENERVADTTIMVSDSLLHPIEWRPVLPPPKSKPFETSMVERRKLILEPVDVARAPQLDKFDSDGIVRQERDRPLADLAQDLHFAARTLAFRLSPRGF